MKELHLDLYPDADGAMTEAAAILLKTGADLNASDLHIEPWYPRLRFRINGYFRDCDLRLSDIQMQNLAGRLKVLACLKPWEQGLIQEGRIEGEFFDSSFPLRMSVFPTINGEKIALRYLGHGQKLSRLTDLGYSARACSLIRDTLFSPSGLFLIYGSSNSGKTTAAYAVLNEISACRSNAVSIATIEDPVERNTRLFAQTDLSAARGISYEKALKSLLRQDPEVIFVGEIRDAGTAAIAFQAALTGHFIVTTLHAGSLSEGLLRLMGFGLDVRQIFMVLRMALGLELFPVNCEHCRVFSDIEAGKLLKNTGDSAVEPGKALKNTGISAVNNLSVNSLSMDNLSVDNSVVDSLPADNSVVDSLVDDNLLVERITCASSTGCEKCAGLRFSGRTAVYDLLQVSELMHKAIVDNPADWSKLILKRNISRFNVLLELIKNGVISPYEIFRQV